MDEPVQTVVDYVLGVVSCFANGRQSSHILAVPFNSFKILSIPSGDTIRPFKSVQKYQPHSITEVSFDDLALPAREDTVSLDRVVQMDWISHLGRPL